jgi:meiotic recombination protein SPO11
MVYSLLTCSRNWVISRVEGILEGLVDGLLEDGNDLSITLKTRSGTDRRNTGPTRHQEGVLPSKSRKINFPGANAQEAWRFS